MDDAVSGFEINSLAFRNKSLQIRFSILVFLGYLFTSDTLFAYLLTTSFFLILCPHTA